MTNLDRHSALWARERWIQEVARLEARALRDAFAAAPVLKALTQTMSRVVTRCRAAHSASWAYVTLLRYPRASQLFCGYGLRAARVCDAVFRQSRRPSPAPPLPRRPLRQLLPLKNSTTYPIRKRWLQTPQRSAQTASQVQAPAPAVSKTKLPHCWHSRRVRLPVAPQLPALSFSSLRAESAPPQCRTILLRRHYSPKSQNISLVRRPPWRREFFHTAPQAGLPDLWKFLRVECAR